MSPPKISVVVPTHDRFTSVSRLLAALRIQSVSPDDFEVVVVADGCQDGTPAKIRAAHWPFRLNVLEQPSSGASAARNRGAETATGDLLLFLDDDVEPDADVVRAHAAAHAADDGVVGLGRLRPAVGRDDFFGVALRGGGGDVRAWGRIRTSILVFDLLSGHFSIRRRTFMALGGFDTSLRCREDYELGYRINAAGLRFRLITGAAAKHRETSDLAKAMRRKFDEGIADVALCERYSALGRGTSTSTQAGWIAARVGLVLACLVHPGIGDSLAARVAGMLPVYEFWRLRYRWRMRVEDLFGYWYWRGVATATGSRDRLSALLANAPVRGDACLTVDLEAGLAAAEAQLDLVRPVSVRFVYGTHFVGELPEAPGAEPIRGIHLSRIIARQFANEYPRAACVSRAVPEILLNPDLDKSFPTAISPGAAD